MQGGGEGESGTATEGLMVMSPPLPMATEQATTTVLEERASNSNRDDGDRDNSGNGDDGNSDDGASNNGEVNDKVKDKEA